MSFSSIPLIPRDLIFGNPKYANVQVSHDGTFLSYLAPSEKDVLNVWVRTVGRKDDRMVTQDDYRGIRMYTWSYHHDHILYLQDSDGDENFHLYTTNVRTATTRDLTPYEGVRASNIIIHWEHPKEVIIGLNKRNPALFDLYRVDIESGDIRLDTENPGDVGAWETDHDLKLRACIAIDPESGDTVCRYRQDESQPWDEIFRLRFDENFDVVGFDPDNRYLRITTSQDSDTDRLLVFDPDKREVVEEIFHDPRADLSGFLKEPKTTDIEAVKTEYDKPEWHVIDESIARDLEILQKGVEGFPEIASRSLDSRHWVVVGRSDMAPTRYYHYDREAGSVSFLFSSDPELEKFTFASRRPVTIPTRDGLTMVSYLTEPPDGEGPHPMVLLVHGGPWFRDSWGFDKEAQFLANRGYAVLQVNFRCSTGFGKSYMNAGNQEWGGKAQDDLTDAVNWAIDRGIAPDDQVAIVGGSYGGYATLAGLAFTPDLYRCGVDIVGPSNLKTLLETIPPYWEVGKRQMILRIGDVENDSEFNRARSPLFHAERIRAPLLVAQGKNDPRVKIAESDQIVEAMRSRDLPVTYVVYTDEGHGFARPENRLDFYGRMEEFLAEHMGGRCQPYEPVENSKGELH